MTILLPAPLHIDEETSFGLSAPTSSTTVALALGDALALATAQQLHTLPEQGPSEVFKGYHPGGTIGAAAAASSSSSIISSNSTISTPSTSMTTSPSLSSIEYALPIKLDEDDNNENSITCTKSNIKTETTTATIYTSPHFVAIEHIPTVSSLSASATSPEASNTVRIIDILLTAIQNPLSKSWTKLSDTQIVPPDLLRSLTSTSSENTYNIHTPLNDIHTPISIPSAGWLRVPASSSVDKVRCFLEEENGNSTMQMGKYTVISVVDDTDEKVLGFVSVADLHSSSRS